MVTLHPFAIDTRVVRTTSGSYCGYVGTVIEHDGDRVRVQWDATHCHPKGVKTWVKFTEVDFETDANVSSCKARKQAYLSKPPRFRYR